MNTCKQVMAELKKLGSEQSRKIYARHGAGPIFFGVKFADLYKIQKSNQNDHELALELWETKNTDAQNLAILIADPEKFTKSQANSWVKDINYFMLSNYLGGLLAKTSFAKEKMEEWMNTDKEYYLNTAYSCLSTMLKNEDERITEADCKKYLKKIEKKIHKSPNRGKSAMNWAVIAIGTYKLEKEAKEAGKRIGKVEVDHGDTSCKTPEIIPYIDKALARLKKKKN